MIISLIVAIGPQREIGLDGKIPWHLKKDLKNFKKITLDHCILMGRKTYDSIGFPLPRRTSIVVSRDNKPKDVSVDIIWVNSFLEGVKVAQNRNESELFIIGGSEIYALAMPYCHRLYLSCVDYKGKASTYMPAFEHAFMPPKEILSYASEENTPAWTFQILEKKKEEITPL